jgi:hypothetical protein
MSSVGDSRKQWTESAPAGKGSVVLVPGSFAGQSSGSSKDRDGGVNRGFCPDNSGKGDGEFREFIGDRGRVVNAMIEEEGKDWCNRNKWIW